MFQQSRTTAVVEEEEERVNGNIVMKKRKFYEIDCLEEATPLPELEKKEINKKRMKPNRSESTEGEDKVTLKSFFGVGKIVKTTVGVKKTSEEEKEV